MDQYQIALDGPKVDEQRAPAILSLNSSLFMTFPIRDRMRAEQRQEVTSVTNTAKFAASGTNIKSTATFGVISSGGGNRAMQGAFQLRIVVDLNAGSHFGALEADNPPR